MGCKIVIVLLYEPRLLYCIYMTVLYFKQKQDMTLETIKY